MGVKTSAARLLCYLKRNGLVDFRRTLMLGRQELCMTESQIRALYRDYADVLKGEIRGKYCEALFRALGAETADSLDVSDFEGAACIADLNKPVPPELEGRYTCVLDGGTTEHVYNYPQAMQNIMRMLDTSGGYIALVPSDHWNGHGLFQFSPMLYIQLFQKENNFELLDLYFSKSWNSRCLWKLKDRGVQSRIEIISRAPLELYAVAKKTGEAKTEICLQQGDYIEKWSGGAKTPKWKSALERLPWETQAFIKYHYLVTIGARKRLKKVRF